jgi:hypoxanthine phosphoribosyltransferase
VDAADMGADLEEVLITPERLQERIAELAGQIDADYADRELLLVGVLKGAVMVMADLARAMRLPVQMDWMAVSSYGSGTKSSGVVRILKDLDCDITGRHVLVVEDIIDSGLTLSWLVRNLQSRGPASLRVCALLRKPGAARVDVDVAYTGFDIADAFVIGYGLDYAERYRNLPFIGTLAPHVYRGPAAADLYGRRGTHPRGTQCEMKYVHWVGNGRRPRRRRRLLRVGTGRRGVPSIIAVLPGGQKGKLRVGAGTQGSPGGGRRDLRLVRRGRPARGAAVRRWI